MEQESRINKPKSKIAQFFCKHKRTCWCTKVSTYYNISGERRYLVCEDCGKVLNSYFHKYD